MMIKDIILTSICNFLCLFNLVWIYSIITNHKFKIKITILFLLLFCTAINTFLYFLNIVPLKTIASILILIMCNKFIYKNNWNTVIIYSFLIWISGMVLDLLFILGFSSINAVYLKIASKRLEYYIMSGSSLILQVIYNLVSRCKWLKKLFQKFYKTLTKIHVDYILIAIMIVMFVSIGAITVNNKNDSLFVVFSLILSILLLIIFLLYFSKKYQKIHLNETISILLENNKFYSNLNTDFREYKHNLVHKLYGLKLYSNKKSLMLIEDIISDCNKLAKNSNEFDKLPLGLSGYFYQKIYQYECSDLNILIDNSIRSDLFDILKPNNYNKLCETLGVLLDNSIQAALISNDKMLYISAEEHEKYLEISIKNSFGSRIDLDKLGSLDYTTKGKNHGIGLFSILKNRNVKTNIKINNNIFEVVVIVKKIIKTLD